MAKLIPIKTFSSRTEATLSETKLRAHDIHSVISGQDSGGAHPFRGINTKLLVQEEDYEKAAEILNQD